MAGNYAYMGKGIVTMKREGSSDPAIDIGNVSALAFTPTENVINAPNYRTPGGGNYAQVRRIETVEVSMTLYDLSPENLAMVLFGTVTKSGGRAVIEALTTGAQTFEMVFNGVNEVDSSRDVIVTAYRVKIGAAQGLGFIGDEFGTLEVTGELLIDTTKTGAGVSQFFNVDMALAPEDIEETVTP